VLCRLRSQCERPIPLACGLLGLEALNDVRHAGERIASEKVFGVALEINGIDVTQVSNDDVLKFVMDIASRDRLIVEIEDRRRTVIRGNLG
jgi:hypothetical protein